EQNDEPRIGRTFSVGNGCDGMYNYSRNDFLCQGAGTSLPSAALTASRSGATRWSMLGSNTSRCRPARRQFLTRSLLSATYASLAGLIHLRAVAGTREQTTADSCILLFLNGGMSHLDTMDPKPDQPGEIRGDFATIRTTIPGTLVTEHLPLLARQAHRYAIGFHRLLITALLALIAVPGVARAAEPEWVA